MTKSSITALHEIMQGIEFSTEHEEEWKNIVATHLNTLVGRAVYELETSELEVDREFAYAVWRTCERVAEFEKLTCKGITKYG